MVGLMESLKGVRKDAKVLGKWGTNSWRNAEDGCCYCNNTLLSACLCMWCVTLKQCLAEQIA